MASRDVLIAVARGERVSEDVEPFLEAAAAEGLTGLLARSAEQMPRALRVQALGMEARSARMIAELARIAAAFDVARIPLLVFKGAVLAQQLYGDPGARAFSDIDVIVDPANAEAGEMLLQRLGYRETEPMTTAQRRTNRRFDGESLLVDDVRERASGVLADFHWRFSNLQFPLRIDFAAAWERRQSVIVDGHSFATLGEADLAVFTCSHAAKHLWHRLELLAQAAALTKRTVDWQAVERLAIDAGVARQVGLSFLLTRDILDVAPPPIPHCLAAAAPVLESVRRIVDRNLFAENRRSDARGSDLFLLLDRRRDAVRSLLLAIFVPTHSDWRGSNLPAALHWIVRPFRLLWSRLASRQRAPAELS
ncbi:MAG TPA: nucleotidyltransferase family protein [Thermoanaerobaculia bacterium]|nr:nucleotidyltransferase family protein [Thermoanaerobaculia bacterium]